MKESRNLRKAESSDYNSEESSLITTDFNQSNTSKFHFSSGNDGSQIALEKRWEFLSERIRK